MMRLSADDREAMVAMLHAIELIVHKTTGYKDLADSDEFTQWGVFYGLVRLGEASTGVSAEGRALAAELPWRQMKDLRNRLAHGYDLPSLPIVWNVVRYELPQIETGLRRLLSEGGV